MATSGNSAYPRMSGRSRLNGRRAMLETADEKSIYLAATADLAVFDGRHLSVVGEPSGTARLSLTWIGLAGERTVRHPLDDPGSSSGTSHIAGSVRRWPRISSQVGGITGWAAARFARTGLTGCASRPAARVAISTDLYPCRGLGGMGRAFIERSIGGAARSAREGRGCASSMAGVRAHGRNAAAGQGK
ncbi:hypothetical protein OY671_008969 [Metschnikowia pulcherrima]|nr:hypothetical protein OY671_008969 [Metschnikowia pulcherrima]